MAIKDTYAEFITKQIIQDLLLEGVTPSVSIITDRFDEFITNYNISKPLFNLQNSIVSPGEHSSASLFNSTMLQIQQDLKVLYKHLFKISEAAIFRFHRWRTDAELLTGRLKTLKERINTLLLLSSETSGYFNFVQDNFTNTSKVDLNFTSAMVNTEKGLVTLGTTSLGATRINLSGLSNENIDFTILSRNSLISTVATQGSQRVHIVNGTNNYWQERAYFSKPGAVTAELKIDLKTERAITRIDINLHTSNQNSTVQLTPVYSTDNYNWQQCPVNNPTRSVLDKVVFQFPEITARWVKFVLTKAGFDQVHHEMYAYEFGIDQISFYNEGFDINQSVELVSQPLWIKGTDGNPEEFSKIILEVCEDIPDQTNIFYSVAASNSSTMSATAGFVRIDPANRDLAIQPTILDFGQLDTVVINNIKTSYDPTHTTAKFRNPAKTFTYLESITLGQSVTKLAEASIVRYVFKNNYDRILDLQIKPANIDITKSSLELWRNTVQRGINNRVRGLPAGWGYKEPYYTTTVYIDNAMGYLIDTGEQPIAIDESLHQGKIRLSQGKHKIGIHKNQWTEIDFTSITDEASLILTDLLYPYNHRYLIEGIDYPSNWPTNDKQVYLGFDIMAEYICFEISPFDFANNITNNDYNKFAIDYDIKDSGRTLDGLPSSSEDALATQVLLIKTDGSNPDFLNENFTLSFKTADVLFKYLRFKAVLETYDGHVAPFLDSYRIKLSK